MSKVEAAEQQNNSFNLWSTCQDYYELTKPKVVLLLLLTALVGMCLATDTWVSWQILIAGLTGIGFLSSAAAVVNHVVDRNIDGKMAR
ncbi:MAG: UbiA family prenyltransferase, partial [Paraglaciecola sp.]|nr:UbiA family prenyltransferase [Paraglaciecola sp.]